MKRFFPLFTALFLMGSMMVVQADTYTVAGSSSVFGSNWSLTDTNNDMTLENGLYKLVKTDVVLGDEVQLKVVKNRSWSTSWPASNYVIPITETAVYTVTVTFNASSGTVTATAEKTGEAGPIVSTYTVAGDNTDVFGTEWDPANTANDMTSVGTLYKWEKQVVMSASTIEFKVCKDHGWGNAWPSSNFQVTFPKWGGYILTVTFNPDSKDVNAFYVEKYYTVVGSEAALFGTAWGQDNEDNDMTLQSDGITYKKSYYNVELTAGEIQYKVAADHSWGSSGEYPAGNQVLSIPEDGKYNVTFTYVPSDPSLVAEATLIPEQEIYTVVGSEAALFGTAWETNEPANDMVLQSDGITYVKSYSNVSLNSGDIEYKVAKDHKWGTGEYPTGGLNQKLNIPSNGTYDVTFTYVPSIPSLEAVATLIEPSVDPVQTTITIKGKVPAEWTNAIYVYLYSTDADGFHAATQEGEWWSYTYSGESSSINAIFVNGSSWSGLPAYYQTVDITDISADACYELTYHTGAKATYVGVDCPSTPEPPVVLGVRLYGDFITPGNPMDTEIFTGDDESVSLKMNLLEGNYVFGLVINDVMIVNGAAFTRENPSAEITDGNNELTLDADVDGEYTFTWTFASNTLSIDYPAAVTPEYATIKFFAPRDQTNKWDHVYAYATKGNKKDFGPKPGTEITDKDAEWYVVTVRKGSNLLFTDNAGMETTVIENIQDDACYVSTAINYEVTPKIVSLTEQCYVDYYVAGDAAIMGSWGAAVAACKFDANNQVIFHDVPAGEYQFKITNGTWAWSIGGNDFLSDEPGCGTIASELGLGNTGFTIDEVQDVTITYYPATRKICLGAITVKTTGELTAYDIDNLYVDELKYPSYNTNITDYTAADVELTFVSGDACVEFVEGQIKGTAEGTAVVKVTIAETALFTGAEATFNVTVSAVPVPPTPSEDWVEVRSGLEAGRHYTVCLEKNVTAVKGATFWSLTYRNEGGTAAYLVEETAPFAAGKPYIFQATGDNDGKLEVVYGTETAINPVVNGALRGTFSYMDADALAGVEGTVYMLYNNALCPMGTNNHLDAHRAYVLYDLLQEAPVQGFAPGKRVKSMPMQGQTTTGIDALNTAEAPVKMIIDGNLYILRGEKMYDATGRLVK